MRNETCVGTQTSKVPTQVALLFISLCAGVFSSEFIFLLGVNTWGGGVCITLALDLTTSMRTSTTTRF